MTTRTWAAIFSVCAGFFAFGPSRARADEFKLKDGTKITGTIVGFENGTFTVQTSYGYALVDKDKIAEIIPSVSAAKAKDAKPPEKIAKPAAEATGGNDKTAADEKSATEHNAAKQPEPAIPAAASSPSNGRTANSQPPPANSAKSGANVSSSQPAAPAAPEAAQPAKPAPEPIRESVEGTQYINQTFGFRLYKPPSWDLIPDARSVLESAVAALGTFDETTLMVIAREPLEGSVEKHADSTQQRVRSAYENFRIISTRSGTVAGSASNERHYRGVIDGHDWSGVIVTFARGSDVYTILGATRAETDLVQIQENVIARTIASLQFDDASTHRQ